MDELARVKAALEARGFRHRDGRDRQEFELFREVGNVREAARVVKLGGRGQKAPWVVDTWDHAWTGETAEAAIEAVESRYRADAARALRRAEELAEVRSDIKRAEHARTNAYAAACMRLQRRMEAGEPDDVLDVERERLADEWHCLPDEDAEALRALMSARRGGQVDRAAQLRLADEIERKAAGMKPGNPPEDGRKYRVVTDEGLETVVWCDNPGGFPFQNGVNSFETDEIPWHDPVPVEDEMSERVELSNEIKALGLEHCKSEQEVLTQATAEAIAELTEEELREFVRELEGEVLSLRGQIALGNLRARGDLALGLTALGATGGSASGSAEVALGAPQGAGAGGGEAVVREDALDED